MLKFILFVVLFVYGLRSEAQQALSDEHLLKEVAVSSKPLPLDTIMLRFYRTNSLSTTDDVLARLSGLSLIRRGTYALEPTIHGFSAGQIGLTIDGMKIVGACTDKMDPVSCYVEPENLDAIDVPNEAKSKNGSSLAGCIDLKLRKPMFADSSITKAAISLDQNTVAKGSAAAATLDYQSEKFALTTNATYRKNGNYTDGNGTEVLHSAFEKVNFSLSPSVKISPSQRLTASYLFDREWNVGYPALPMDVGLATAQLASLTYQTQLCNWYIHEMELKVYGNLISHLMDDTHRPEISMHMDMPGFSKTGGANFSAKIMTNVAHDVEFKLDYFASSLLAKMIMYPKGESPMFMLTLPDNLRQTTGIYLADRWTVSHEFSFSANARLDLTSSQLTSDFGKAELSVLGKGEGDVRIKACKNVETTVNFHPLESLSISSSIHHGERLPTANEWYGYYLFVAFDGYDHIGNTQLKTESANTLDLSFNITQGRFKLRTRAFKSFISQYISLDSTSFSAMTIGAKGVRRYVNKPSASIAGVDCELLYQLDKHWQLLATSKYLYGNDGDGNPLPMIMPLKSLLNIRYSISKFSITGECETAANQNHVASYMGEIASKAYAIYHLRFSYTLVLKKTQQLDLMLAGENLSNKTYREHLDWGNVYRPGRNVNVSLKYVF